MSSQLERLQQAFDVLIGLLDWVGLMMNTLNTASMYCQPCHKPVRMLVVAYTRMKTGTGPTYQYRQRIRAKWLECGSEVVTGRF